MKRKINQVGTGTYTVSLPMEWIKLNKLAKGDLLEVLIENKNLSMIAGPSNINESITIDITEFDRTSIFETLRALYRNGYDEIKCIFNKPETLHTRTKNSLKIIEVISEEVSRLIGFEITDEKKDSCIIKDLSGSDYKTFDEIYRKVFHIMVDLCRDLYQGYKNNDKVILEAIYHKHFTLHKFSSYCLRSINKNNKMLNKHNLFSVLINTDLINDKIKHGARLYLKNNSNFSNLGISVTYNVLKSMETFEKFYFSYNPKLVYELNDIRDSTKEIIYNNYNKFDKKELFIIGIVHEIQELIRTMTYIRIVTSVEQFTK